MGAFNCGLKFEPGQPIWAWTCPCGKGYWDGVNNKFITGAKVRNGEAPSRADYEAHLRTCSKCYAQAQRDPLTLVPSREESRDAKGLKSSHDRKISSEQRSYFLPMEGINPHILQIHIERLLGHGTSYKFATGPVRTNPTSRKHRQMFLTLFFAEVKTRDNRETRLQCPLEH